MGKPVSNIKFKDLYVGMPVVNGSNKGEIVLKKTSKLFNYIVIEADDGHVNIDSGKISHEHVNSRWSYDSQKG